MFVVAKPEETSLEPQMVTEALEKPSLPPRDCLPLGRPSGTWPHALRTWAIASEDQITSCQ